MKPSKVLKEYIERKVKEAYGKESQAELDYKQARKEFEEEVEKANAKVREFTAQVYQNINNPHNFKVSTSSTTPFTTWCYGGEMDELQKASRKAEQERHDKINTTIEDILIELELGGTKAQLEERLANL